MSVPSDKIISPLVSGKLSLTKETWKIEIVAHKTKIVPIVAVADKERKSTTNQQIE